MKDQKEVYYVLVIKIFVFFIVEVIPDYIQKNIVKKTLKVMMDINVKSMEDSLIYEVKEAKKIKIMEKVH